MLFNGSPWSILAVAAVFSGANFSLLWFTSGGQMGIDRRCTSATNTLILSVSLTALLNSAAMNSTGKFAFKNAVRQVMSAYAAAWLLLKTVTGELFEQIENGVRLFFVDVVHLRAALDEVGALLGHLFLVLLAHGAAEQIGLAQRVTREHVGPRAAPVPGRS